MLPVGSDRHRHPARLPCRPSARHHCRRPALEIRAVARHRARRRLRSGRPSRRTGSDLGQRQEPASLCGSRVPAGLRPYDQVQPLVQRVLQRFPVTASANSWQLQNLPAPWAVCCCRAGRTCAQPSPTTRLCRNCSRRCNKARSPGRNWTGAWIRLGHASTGCSRPGVPALQSTYAFWEARWDHSDGITGQYRSALFVRCRTSARYSGIRRRSFSSVASTPGPTPTTACGKP